MKFARSIISLATCLYVATALPIPDGCSATKAAGKAQPAVELSEAQLLQAAPDSGSCDGATPECATASQAVPHLNAAHAQFGVNTTGEIAAIVGLQLFESGSFKFNTNQGGNPGQGTRNLMTFPFMLQYALDTPSTKDAALALVPSGKPDGVPPDVQNQIRALMLKPETDFASGAWFLKTICTPDIISGLQAGTDAGWEAFHKDCVGVNPSEERRQVYKAVLAALG